MHFNKAEAKHILIVIKINLDIIIEIIVF